MIAFYSIHVNTMGKLQTDIEIIFNIKSMRPSKQEVQECYHSPFIKNARTPLLRNIVEEIKHLQNYVSQMDIDTNQEIKQQRQVRSEKKRKQTSIGRSSKETKKRDKEETSANKYQNIKTIRSPKVKNQSVGLKQSGHSCHSQSAQRSESETRGQVMQFPLSYISLQFENIELQRQNMRLQKKLLQQQLVMERRQKQLLKNRLKKIKTHNIINMLPSSSASAHKSQATQAHSSTYDNTPIKIKIPEFKSKHQEYLLSYSKSKRQHKLSNNYTTKTFESIASFKNGEEDDDELLISRLSCQQNGKENAGLLERQFWTLLSQSQAQKCEKKWEIRQALGDIANKLKAMRRQ